VRRAANGTGAHTNKGCLVSVLQRLQEGCDEEGQPQPAGSSRPPLGRGREPAPGSCHDATVGLELLVDRDGANRKSQVDPVAHDLDRIGDERQSGRAFEDGTVTHVEHRKVKRAGQL
jgi:hypothetical protein